jgi:hypothetical protein
MVNLYSKLLCPYTYMPKNAKKYTINVLKKLNKEANNEGHLHAEIMWMHKILGWTCVTILTIFVVGIVGANLYFVYTNWPN